MGSKAIIILFFAATSGILASCSKENPQHSSGVQQDVSVPIERIVSVERYVDVSGIVVLLVPRDVVFRQGELSGVYVVGSDGRISARWVRTGRIEGEYLVILGGLDAGEEVVAGNNRKLREGVRVKEHVSVTKKVQSNE